jgi:hypothetical protein
VDAEAMTRLWRIMVGAACLSLPFAIACTGKSAHADETVDKHGAGSPPAAPTEDEAESPEDAATQAYGAANDYLETALAAPDPTDQKLVTYYSGPALDLVTQILLTAQQNHEYYESTIESDPVAVTSGSDEVVFSDCLIESVTVYDAASKSVKNTASTTHNWQVRVVRTGAVWRVEEIIRQEEPCTPS